MSSRPYVALNAALVADSDVPHAGANRLDRAEYEALIEWLGLIKPEHYRTVMSNPLRAHLAEAAVSKLQGVLTAPKADVN